MLRQPIPRFFFFFFFFSVSPRRQEFSSYGSVIIINVKLDKNTIVAEILHIRRFSVSDVVDAEGTFYFFDYAIKQQQKVFTLLLINDYFCRRAF